MLPPVPCGVFLPTLVIYLLFCPRNALKTPYSRSSLSSPSNIRFTASCRDTPSFPAYAARFCFARSERRKVTEWTRPSIFLRPAPCLAPPLLLLLVFSSMIEILFVILSLEPKPSGRASPPLDFRARFREPLLFSKPGMKCKFSLRSVFGFFLLFSRFSDSPFVAFPTL